MSGPIQPEQGSTSKWRRIYIAAIVATIFEIILLGVFTGIFNKP